MGEYSWAITELVATIPACFQEGNFFVCFDSQLHYLFAARWKESKREQVTYLANDSNSLKIIKSSLSVNSLLLCLTLRHIIFAENKTQVIKEGKTEPVNNKKQISEAEKLKCSVRKSWATPVLYTTMEFSTPSSGHHSHFHNKAQERQIQHTLKQAARYTCPKMLLNFFSSPSASFLSRDVPVARIQSHIRSDNCPPYQIPFCLTPY